ncbi:hypothetical protein AB4090_14035 [Acidithiobacillus sp. IBUN Pt1247-S3]|uniref:hypothetical protein n=1 Tax=Acidithiobacillus sp. IBUN Pt1247-S3 TaxID=3166642 RepID=UPI0034E60B45
MNTTAVGDSWADDLPRIRYLVGPGQPHSYVLLQYLPDGRSDDALLIVLHVAVLKQLDCVLASDYKRVAWICSAISEVYELSTETVERYLRIKISQLSNVTTSFGPGSRGNDIFVFRSKYRPSSFPSQTEKKSQRIWKISF